MHDCFGPLPHLLVPQSKRHQVLALMRPGELTFSPCIFKNMVLLQAGILFSLFASYLRVLAKTFPCHPLLRATHLIAVCLLFASVARQLFGEKKEGSAPILPFMGIALYAVAPIVHSAIVSESDISIASIAWLFLPHLLVINKNKHTVHSSRKCVYSSFMCLAKAGLGVLVYLLRFPEKLLPAGLTEQSSSRF